MTKQPDKRKRDDDETKPALEPGKQNVPSSNEDIFEAEVIADGESEAAKKTRLAKKSQQPTMLAPDQQDQPQVPNLNLDQPEEAIEVAEVVGSSAVVSSEEALIVGSSAVLADEVVSVPGSAPGKKPSSIVEAHEVVDEAEVVMADEVIEALDASQPSKQKPETPPAHPVRTGPQEESPSGSIFAGEILEVDGSSRGREKPTASLDVFSAELQELSGLGNTSAASKNEEVDLFGETTGGHSKDSGNKTPTLARPAESAIGLDDDRFDHATLDDDDDGKSLRIRKPKTPASKKEEQVLDVSETIPVAGESSGIRWEEVGPPSDSLKNLESDQTVAFDDSAEGASIHLFKKDAEAGVDDLAEALESGVDLDKGAVTPSAKKKKPEVANAELDDLATADDVAPPGKTKSKVVKVENDLPEDVGDNFLPDVEDKPTPRKKSKAVRSEDETVDAHDEDLPAAGKRAAKGQRRPPKPRYGRRWVGGILLGSLLTAGGLAAVGYFKPDLIEEGLAYSPEVQGRPKKTPPPKVVPLAPTLMARQEIEAGNFDQAIETLEKEDKNANQLAALAEARWLKYLDLKKNNINIADPEVKQVLGHLNEAKESKNAQALGNQIMALFQAKDLADQVARLKVSEKTLATIAKQFKDGNNLPAAVQEMIATGAANKKLVEDFADALVKGMFLSKEDREKLDGVVFQNILKDLGDKQNGLASVNKVLENANIKDAGAKGVLALVAAKKDIDDKLSAVNKLLAEDKLDPGGPGVKILIDARKQLTQERNLLDQAVKAAFAELAEAKVVEANADPRSTIAGGAKLLRQKAESPLAMPLSALTKSLGGMSTGASNLLQKGFDYAALLTELQFYRVREPLVRGPDKNLDGYIAQFQSPGNTSPQVIADAVKEAQWLLSEEAKSSAEVRAKAYLVLGLIERNQEKYSSAKKYLDSAHQESQGLKGATWRPHIENALQILNNPAFHYLPESERLAGEGNFRGAHELLTKGLKALPNNGQLLAQRAQIRLDGARGKLPAELQQAIRTDAEAALKDARAGAAAAFVLGQLAETVGDLAKAESFYRQALKNNQGGPEEGSRYQAALARLLLDERLPANPPHPGPKLKGKKDVDADSGGDEEIQLDPHLQTMLLLALVGVQPADDEDNSREAIRIKESIELANDLIKSDNPKIKGQGYLLLGQAWAKQGRRTDGLKEFVKGMSLLYPGLATKDMAKLLDDHPAFQQPDANKLANPYLAERFFGRGQHLYFDKNYEAAEKEFQQAIKYFDKDARYRYFLGLSQLAQKTKLKRDAAIYSFEEGARLEAANRPFVSDINVSLERIQGDLRQHLNTFRQKAVEKVD